MLKLKEANLKGKKVLYRPDYNVPLKDGVIADDFRIQATVPTLDYLIAQGAKIIIASHLGRPDGHEMPEFELRPVAERLADQYPEHIVQLAHKIDDTAVTKAIERMSEGDILVLPNVRFYPEEESNNEAFGHMLATLADVYVNDAFACDHRGHASIVGPEKYLPSYPGFLLEKELEKLGELLAKPEKPFVVIMGGAKVSDKIDVIKSLGALADHILIGGAMANTFVLAKGEKIGDSKAEPDKVHVAEDLVKTLGEKLVLAKDFVKEEVGESFKYMDIGEEAVAEFKEYLKAAKTIFWNGSLGYVEDPRFAKASQEITEYVGGLTGVTSIVAGGDTVEMLTRLKLHDKFSFVSTGGGAALEFLGGMKLPGVEALEEAAKREGKAPEVVVEEEIVEAKPESEAKPEVVKEEIVNDKAEVKVEPEAEAKEVEPVKEEK